MVASCYFFTWRSKIGTKDAVCLSSDAKCLHELVFITPRQVYFVLIEAHEDVNSQLKEAILMRSCHVLVCFTLVRLCLDSVVLFSFHFAGIEETSVQMSVMQTASPFVLILSYISRLSYLILFSLTHKSRFSSSFAVKLYYIYMFFLTHVLLSHYLKEFPGKEADLRKIN